MPKANAKKTRWALSLTVFACCVMLIITWLQTDQPTVSQPKEVNQAQLQLNNATVPLEVVATNIARQKGLSDRDSLVQDTGMLFEFEQPAEQCFWMKDMRFSIDMIWLDADKKVLRIKEAVSPATYPESFCVDNTKYVIELNAGDAKKQNIATGQYLRF